MMTWKCALGRLREDNTRRWGCGKVSEDVFTPSHLINNDLVRIAVAFLKEHQGEETVAATFECAERDFFTGTGSSQLNRELANGHREFDGTTTMTYRQRYKHERSHPSKVYASLSSFGSAKADMEFVQNFTPPDFQAKNFTLSISPNFNSFSKKKHKK